MSNFNDFNPNNDNNNNNNVDWNNYVNNDNFNQMNQNNVNNNNDYYNYNRYNYNNVAPKPKKNNKVFLIAMLVALILVFVGGVGIFIFNSNRMSSNKDYNEYTRLENINDVIGTKALSVEAKFYKHEDYYDLMYVVLEVSNDSDYFINDLPVKYLYDGYPFTSHISMRPHTKAVLDCFTIDDKEQDYYKDMELKDPGYSSYDNENHLSKEAKENIIYASDISIEITNVDDQGVHFKVNNSSKYDFELDSFYTEIMAIDSNDSNIGEILYGLEVKDINSKDSSNKFNIPKEGSRELIYAPAYDDYEFDPKLDYKIISVFCGKQVF